MSEEFVEAKQLKYDKAYLRMAQTWAELSHCSRKKVGAIIVKDNAIVSMVHLLVLITAVKQMEEIHIGMSCTRRQMQS